MADRREQKKLATRQRISDAATELFLSNGFEAVTFDDIAARAKVSRMTVFNYFPRKEDLMLDRQDDLKLLAFRDAVRLAKDAPVAALREVAADLRSQRHSFARFDEATALWWRFVAETPSLDARLRELDEEAAEGLAAEIPGAHGLARFAAGVIVLGVRTGRQEATRLLEQGATSTKARAAFFALLDHAFTAVEALGFR